MTEKNCNICELIIWILWVFCLFFQILSQNFELCSETNILSQQLSYLCRLLISGLRNAPILSIWKNWQVIFLSSLSTAGTKCKVKQYNSHDTPNFDVSNQNYFKGVPFDWFWPLQLVNYPRYWQNIDFLIFHLTGTFCIHQPFSWKGKPEWINSNHSDVPQVKTFP